MRNSIDVVIPPGLGRDRDLGKTFRITEMAAFQAERWATRAILVLTPRLAQEVSPEVADELKETAGLASMGRVCALLGGISFPELEPLLDELVNDGSPGKIPCCVQIVTDPRLAPRAIGLGGADDIEEIETIRYLRQEVLNLHTGFTFAAAILGLVGAVATVLSEATSTSLSQSVL